MKIPCQLVEDMLPIYYDGACSEGSAHLIRQHLEECQDCSKKLEELDRQDLVVFEDGDDLKPLTMIQTKWQESKRNSFLKGIVMTICLIFSVSLLLLGIWYFDYGKYYYQMTENMEKTSEEDRFFTSSDYTYETEEYRFEVWLPMPYSHDGFARAMDEHGLVMFLYRRSGGEYEYRFYITDEGNRSWTVYLTEDLQPDFEGHPFPYRSEEEKEKICKLVDIKREEIGAMADLAKELWQLGSNA